jgi:hypothetical protein
MLCWRSHLSPDSHDALCSSIWWTPSLVWRGRATDTIDSDSEAREQQLRTVEARMFEGFPAMPGARVRPRAKTVPKIPVATVTI